MNENQEPQANPENEEKKEKFNLKEEIISWDSVNGIEHVENVH